MEKEESELKINRRLWTQERRERARRSMRLRWQIKELQRPVKLRRKANTDVNEADLERMPTEK